MCDNLEQIHISYEHKEILNISILRLIIVWFLALLPLEEDSQDN
jgi:hypothetical protein